VIAHADRLLDFGPGAGRNGGQIVAEGSPQQVGRLRGSVTGNGSNVNVSNNNSSKYNVSRWLPRNRTMKHLPNYRVYSTISEMERIRSDSIRIQLSLGRHK